MARGVLRPLSVNRVEEEAREALHTVIDPEVGVNIVDLGLVYAIEASEERVHVTMTMTTPACPLGEMLRMQARDAVAAKVPEHEVEVELVWQPPWGPERMAPAAKKLLGLND